VRYAGQVDLEKPVSQVGKEGCAFAVVVKKSPLRVPIHVRYQTPSTRQYETVSMERANLVWTCPKEHADPDHEMFADVLGVFDKDVDVYQVPGLRYSQESAEFRIPVGQLGELFIVQSVTSILVVLATLLVMGVAWTKRL